MNTYKEREEEAYRLAINELGIEALHFDEQSIISTSAGTQKEQQDLVVSILVLHAKFFELALRIDAGISDDKNMYLMRAKKVYAQAAEGLDAVFNHHAELLVDDEFTTRKINMDKLS